MTTYQRKTLELYLFRERGSDLLIHDIISTLLDGYLWISMDLVHIVSEDDNTEEQTVGWMRNPKTNSRSFSVSFATREKISFTSGDFEG